VNGSSPPPAGVAAGTSWIGVFGVTGFSSGVVGVVGFELSSHTGPLLESELEPPQGVLVVVVLELVDGVEAVLVLVLELALAFELELVVAAVELELVLALELVDAEPWLELLVAAGVAVVLEPSMPLLAFAGAAASTLTEMVASSATGIVRRRRMMISPPLGTSPRRYHRMARSRTPGFDAPMRVRPESERCAATRRAEFADAGSFRCARYSGPVDARPDTSSPMRIDLEQQRELYRRHADEAAQRLVEVLRARLDELVALGFERAFDTVGVHEYGDSTYWKPTEQLSEEAAAELADAIFYLHIPIAREQGDLPEPG
jgi:hypothetical protein